MPTIIALYAGILGIMAIALAAPAGQLRGKTKISVGDGGNPELLLAMRRQANFLETVPLALILLALLEMNGAPPLAIHGLAITLIVARVLHATALKSDSIEGFGRVAGAAGSALVLLVASIWSIVTFF